MIPIILFLSFKQVPPIWAKLIFHRVKVDYLQFDQWPKVFTEKGNLVCKAQDDYVTLPSTERFVKSHQSGNICIQIGIYVDIVYDCVILKSTSVVRSLFRVKEQI